MCFDYFASGTASSRPLNERHRQTDSPRCCNGPSDPQLLWTAVVGGDYWNQEMWEHSARRRLEAGFSFVRWSNRLGLALFVVVAAAGEESCCEPGVSGRCCL